MYNFEVKLKDSNYLDKYRINEKITLNCIVINELFYDENKGFGVYEVDYEENVFKVVGIFVEKLNLGLTYKLTGVIKNSNGERQLYVENYEITIPKNQKGIIEFLKTLKGMGDEKAEELYNLFGKNVIEIILNEPEKIIQSVKDIGEKKIQQWQEQIKQLNVLHNTIQKLLVWGLNMQQIKYLINKYDNNILIKIKENPYFLLNEFNTLSFKKCDKIALNMGYQPNGIYRIQEGIKYVLSENLQKGHCYLPVNILIDETKKLLKYKNINITNEEILSEIANLETVNKIVNIKDKVYLNYIYRAEQQVAYKILSLINSSDNSFEKYVEKDLENYLKEKGYVLEEKQKEAVLTFTKGKGGFFILNGSAGCGKTFTLNIILSILEMQYKREGKPFIVKILAPTGKASKVASKATGREATTIHRGLKYNPEKGFEYNENNPLVADCIVVDESSMLDILLAKDLLLAINEGTKVIFLGDTKQLPSVGPGNVLKDLIESNIVPTVTLNVIKRQGKDSGIIKNANRIINGEMIVSCKDTKDAYVKEKFNSYDTVVEIIQAIKEIQKIFNYSLDEIQVLCPQKTTIIGTDSLNYLLQNEFNKNIDGVKILNKVVKTIDLKTKQEIEQPLYFKKGDKVIHIKNNYNALWYYKHPQLGYMKDYENIGITNGECGVIEEIISENIVGKIKNKIVVNYDGKYVIYEDNYDELEHAYAMTIHKSQGSQWKAVIIPILKENYSMLNNNLLYTGYTRSQKFIYVVGQKDAIMYAISNRDVIKRYTSLKDMLINPKDYV